MEMEMGRNTQGAGNKEGAHKVLLFHFVPLRRPSIPNLTTNQYSLLPTASGFDGVLMKYYPGQYPAPYLSIGSASNGGFPFFFVMN